MVVGDSDLVISQTTQVQQDDRELILDMLNIVPSSYVSIVKHL